MASLFSDQPTHVQNFANLFDRVQGTGDYTPPTSTEPTSPLGVSPAVSRLMQNRERKLNRLSQKAGFGELDRTDEYVEMDGYRESMQNKILNNYSANELAAIAERLNQEQGLVQTDQGFFRQDAQGNLTPFEGNPSGYASFYEFATRDGGRKIGTWGGFDPRERYSESYLAHQSSQNPDRPQFIGESGVDPEQLNRHYILPSETVELLEGLYHGSEQFLNNRAVRQAANAPVEEYRALRDRYGTGATEVYRPFEDTTTVDRDKVWGEFLKKYRPESGGKPTFEERAAEANAMFRRREAERGIGLGGRLWNSVLGVPATVASQLLVEPAAAIGEWAGLDMGTEEGRIRFVNDLFNYNEEFINSATEEIGNSVSNIYDAIRDGEPVDLNDIYTIVKEGVTTPEYLTTSLASVAAVIVPMGLAKFTRVGKAVGGVEKELRSGTISAAEAKRRIRTIKNDASLTDRLAHMGAKTPGAVLTITGRANNTLNEFIENNNGEYTATDALRITAVETAIVIMDVGAASFIMRDAIDLARFLPKDKALKAVRETIPDMPPNKYMEAAAAYGRTVTALGVGTGKLTRSMALEGAQEYIVSLAEVINPKYASEKYGSDFMNILTDEETQKEALTGFAIGAVMGGQMEGINTAASALRPSSRPAPTSTPVGTDVSKDKETYNKVLGELAVQNDTPEGLKPENLATYLNNLQTLRSTRYSVKDSDPEKLKNADAVLKQIEDKVYDMIVKSPDGKLNLERIIPVAEDQKDVVVSDVQKKQLTDQDIKLNPITDVIIGTESQSIQILGDGTVATADKGAKIEDILGDKLLTSLSPVNITVTPAVVDQSTDAADTTADTTVVPADTTSTVQPTTEDNTGNIQIEAKADQVLTPAQLTAVKTLADKTGSTITIKNPADTEASPRKVTYDELVAAQKQAPKEVELTSEAKEELVKSVAVMMLERHNGEVPPDIATKLESFGRNNNISKEIIEKVLKSYASVQNEINFESRGIEERTNKLRLMLDSGTAKKQDFQKEYDEIVNWYATTVGSINELKQNIVNAENEAKTLNKSLFTANKKPRDVVSKYKTHKDSSSEGAFFKSVVRYVGGRWVADTKEAQTRIDAKESTRKGLVRLLDEYHQKAADNLDPEKSVDFGGMIVPKGAKNNKGVEKELTYVRNVLDTISEKLGKESPRINKVILSDNRAEHWKATGSRSRSNSPITNSTEYTADDVVYVHSTGFISIPNAKGGKFKISDLNSTTSLAAESMRKAIEAGATIVIDNSLRPRPKLVKGKYKMDRSSFDLLNRFLTGKGYIPLGHKDSSNPEAAYIFVPDTEANAAILAASTEEVAAGREAVKTESKAKKKLVGAKVTLEGAKLLNEPAQEIQKLEAEYEKARDAARVYFTKEAVEETQSAISDTDTVVELVESKTEVSEETTSELADTETTQDVDPDVEVDNTIVEIKAGADPEANMDSYVNRRMKEIVTAEKQAIMTGKLDTDVVTVAPELQALVNAAIETETKKTEVVKTLINGWKDAVMLRLQGNALKGKLNEVLKAFDRKVRSIKEKEKGKADQGDFILRNVGNDIITNAVSYDKDLVTYHIVVGVPSKDGQTRTVEYLTDRFKLEMKVAEITKDENGKEKVVYVEREAKVGDKLGKTTVKGGKEVENASILAINKVEHTPSKYLKLKKDSVLNTVLVEELPEVFRDIAESTHKTLKSVMVPLTKGEKDFVLPKADKTALNELFKTLNSPARALMFDKDGDIHKNMAAAVGIAIRDVLFKEQFKLMLGPKDVKTVAAMFNVNENGVTDEMKQFARDHGVLGRTLANTLGKSVLGSLGLGRKADDELSRGHYERLVSDLGNIAIRAAEKEGLIELKEPKSNTVAKLMGTEIFSEEKAEATTLYINIPTKTVDKKRVIPNKVEKAVDQMKQVNEFTPNVVGSTNQPFYGKPPSKEYIDDVKSKVRNDIVGGKVPQMAQETLEHFMRTPYEMDKDSVEEFFKRLDDTNDTSYKEGIYHALGYVEISDNNPAYTKMLYDDKVIQESINRDIERSIEHLREAYNYLSQENIDNKFYFGFSYTSNHRYMLDSSTLNVQGDKLHRFFVQPKAHSATYKVDKENNTFTYEYKDTNGELKTIESSLYMRGALAQAFGVGIDKTNTDKIIEIGNIILSLNLDQINEIEKKILDPKQKAEIHYGGAKPLVLEPDHISHGLQAIRLLRELQSLKGDTITTSITAEYDALTSGFANKTQQFGVLDNIQEQLGRVGVVQRGSRFESLFNDETKGTNDLLADPDFLDSYKNIGYQVVEKLPEAKKDIKGDKNKKLFELIEPLLPNTDNMSALRSLFKPAFMIFNYSAGINRIVTNLGLEMADGLFEKLAAVDLKDKDSQEYKVLEGLSKVVANMEKSTKGNWVTVTPAELQQMLRTESIKKIRVIHTFKNNSGESITTTEPISTFISEKLIRPTYGKSVESVFNDQFEPFIEIQNVTNDLFKQSFAVFNQLFMERVKQHRAEGGKIITEAHILQWINELRKDFPVIAGPLSNILEEGVHVYNVDTRVPNEVVGTMFSPQGQFQAGAGTTQPKMNPIIKSITAAVNSGAVLPFHALDGAQMAHLTQSFTNYLVKETGVGNAGIVPIHDAIMVSLPFSDIAVWMYNQQTVELNQVYSVFDQLVEMMERTSLVFEQGRLDASKMKPVTGLSFGKERESKMEALELAKIELDNTEKLNLPKTEVERKIANLEAALSFEGEMKKLRKTTLTWAERIRSAREEVFPAGTKAGAMVGFPGSVYNVEREGVQKRTEPDLGYLNDLEVYYSKFDNLSLDGPVDSTSRKESEITMDEFVDGNTNKKVESDKNDVYDTAIKALEDNSNIQAVLDGVQNITNTRCE